MNPSRTSRVLPLVAAVAGFWPVWFWFAERADDGQGESLGIFALLTALAVVTCGATRPHDAGVGGLVASSLLTVLYIVSYHDAPPLARALIAMSVMSLLMCRARGRRFDLGVWGLCVLSLPLFATLQFFLAYPLRVLVGQIAVPLIRLSGFAVERHGTVLEIGGRQLLIDAPCSGLSMALAGTYLTFSLIALLELKLASAAKLLVLTLFTVVAANVMRVAALFYLELGIVRAPAFVHSAVGLVSFVIGGGVITALALRSRQLT